MGFTPQLLAGTWIGCDDRFIRLSGGLGYGGQAARPIWEYFFQKVYADKTLGIEKEARFVQPENMRNEALFDYMNIIDHAPPPGAEGEDQGNGAADQYLSQPDTNHVPVESKLNTEEQKVLNEANKPSIPKKKEEKPVANDKKMPVEEEKKKDGLFKRLFKPREKTQN
jgi:penicillin-binding protein 1A